MDGYISVTNCDTKSINLEQLLRTSKTATFLKVYSKKLIYWINQRSIFWNYQRISNSLGLEIKFLQFGWYLKIAINEINIKTNSGNAAESQNYCTNFDCNQYQCMTVSFIIKILIRFFQCEAASNHMGHSTWFEDTLTNSLSSTPLGGKTNRKFNQLEYW